MEHAQKRGVICQGHTAGGGSIAAESGGACGPLHPTGLWTGRTLSTVPLAEATGWTLKRCRTMQPRQVDPAFAVCPCLEGPEVGQKAWRRWLPAPLSTQLSFLETLRAPDAHPDKALVTDTHMVTFHRLTQLTHVSSVGWAFIIPALQMRE